MATATASPATTVSQSQLASVFLRELGAPDNTVMRKAVVAWMRAESGGHIIGNNPWNLRPGLDDAALRSGTRTSISGNGVFSVYATPQDGARAAARRLVSAGKDWRRYDVIVTSARSGNAIGFLNAVALSAWDGGHAPNSGHYGLKGVKLGISSTGGSNNLLKIFQGIGGNLGTATAGGPVTTDPTSMVPPDATATAGKLDPGIVGAWGNLVQFPAGHILTAADVEAIMGTLAAHGFFKDDPGGIAQSITHTILLSEIGQPWGKPMEDRLAAKFGTAAAQALPKTPLDPLFAVAGSLAQIVGALFDPRKWILFLALIAGAAMTAWGGANIARAAA